MSEYDWQSWILDPTLWAVAFAVIVSFGLLWALRAKRLRKWESLLALPASQIADECAKWKDQLPAHIEFKSTMPLFEILYEKYRSEPKLFAAESLKGALEIAKPLIRLGKMREAGKISVDQEVDQLIGLRSFAQDPEFIPVDAVVGNLIRNLVSVLSGKKKLTMGVEHAVLDSFGAGGGFAGAKIGATLGFFLLPLISPLLVSQLSKGTIVIVPVFMILGAWFGSLAGRMIGERMKSRKSYEAVRKLKTVSSEFKKCFWRSFPKLIKQLDDDYVERIRSTSEIYRARQNFLLRTFFPDLVTAFFRKAVSKLRLDRQQEIQQWKLIRRKMRFMKPVECISILHQLTHGKFLEDQKLQELYKEFELALQAVKDQQKHAA